MNGRQRLAGPRAEMPPVAVPEAPVAGTHHPKS